MQSRTGAIFSAPPGYKGMVSAGISTVPQGMSAGNRLKDIHDA